MDGFGSVGSQRTARIEPIPVGYEAGMAKVWYSSTVAVERAYVVCLLQADVLFANGLEMVPHGSPQKRYNDILQGRVEALPIGWSDGMRADVDAFEDDTQAKDPAEPLAVEDGQRMAGVESDMEEREFWADAFTAVEDDAAMEEDLSGPRDDESEANELDLPAHAAPPQDLEPASSISSPFLFD